MTTIRTDRTFSAHVSPGSRGTRTPDDAWGRRLGDFMNRGNELAIGGHALDAAGMRRIFAEPTAEGRTRVACEVLGQPNLDWGDFRRFADDVMTANPTASGQRFGITEADARTHGIVERDGFDHHRYGTGSEAARRLDLTATAAPPRPPESIPDGPRALIDRAPAAERERLSEAYRAEPAVRRLLGEAPTSVSRPDEQDGVVRALLAGDGPTASRATQLRALVSDPEFASLSHADRVRALDVARVADTDGIGHLRTLVDRGPDSHSGLMGRATGGDHATLLDSLHRAATAPLSPSLERDHLTREGIVSGLLEETASSRAINQGFAGTCGTTSVEYTLARRHPAEYARIVTDLSTNGNTSLLNGDTIARADHIPATDHETRSDSERIFQASLAASAGASTSSGINATQTADQLTRLYDRDVTIYTPDAHTVGSPFERTVSTEETDADGMLEALRASDTHLGVVNMHFGTSADSSHSLAFDHIENGRVYLRNPWGGDLSAERYEGRVRDSLDLRVEDGGLISISEAGFRDNALSVVLVDD